ncbi:MAG: UDP-N-acetylmuramoyl-L-alanyl-D-glutamate--2,6-diaminopimelate ligase [Nitrospirae bacterium]|nr:UDP-N-acetylmuramoyl-L-alanyl-D-glutamate--2,6-diaminopimelate ligase [Nitrospirota bacterium]
MTITELLSGIKAKRIIGRLDKEIKGVAYDSRLVKDGFLFVAVKGFTSDGHFYIEDAISRGATAVVIDRTVDLIGSGQFGDNVIFVEVADSREVLADLSSTFYRKPSKSLSLIGITGTNGKTTTSYITKSILNAWGKSTGLLGTIRYVIGSKTIPSPHTTPESLDLQRYLREMIDKGVRYVVIEVSSHALALKRVNGCSFKVGVFTNFSQDHLDFHRTMDEYFTAKSRLFDYLEKDGFAVLNWDDLMVRSLTEKLNCKVITCGLEEGAMIRAITDSYKLQVTSNKKTVTGNELCEASFGRVTSKENSTNSLLKNSCSLLSRGLSFKVQTPRGELFIDSPLVGWNNVYNILMSVGIAYALGISEEAIKKGVREVEPIEGRFERIDMGQGFLCIVDYAHTEDALRKLIEETRLITPGKVITVFGCGGDRDRGKRPRMGAAATELSDYVVITSDNPRSEEPMDIIKAIEKGALRMNYTIEPDREKAIQKAVETAEEGDILLIAGKGHEDYQEIKGARHKFRDREIAEKAIREKLKEDTRYRMQDKKS